MSPHDEEPPNATETEDKSLRGCLVWPKHGKYEQAIVAVCNILARHNLCDILARQNLNDPTATVPGAEMPEMERFLGDEFWVRLPNGKSPIKDEIRALPEVSALYEFEDFCYVTPVHNGEDYDDGVSRRL